MFLRIAKITIQPGLEEEYLRVHRLHASSFARAEEGNLSVRLFRNYFSDNQFFLYTWWANRRACERVAGSPRYGEIYAEIMTLLLERIEVWMCEVRPEELALSGLTERLRVCGTPQPLDANACVRLIKIAVRPGQESELFERFERWRRAHAGDSGWLAGSIVRCEAPPNTCFLQTWWTSVESSQAMARSPAYAETMTRAYPLLEERVRTWTLQVADEDDRCK